MQVRGQHCTGRARLAGRCPRNQASPGVRPAGQVCREYSRECCRNPTVAYMRPFNLFVPPGADEQLREPGLRDGIAGSREAAALFLLGIVDCGGRLSRSFSLPLRETPTLLPSPLAGEGGRAARPVQPTPPPPRAGRRRLSP